MKDAITAATADGIVSAEEANSIASLVGELGLSLETVMDSKIDAYKAAFNAAMRDGDLSSEEMKALDDMRVALDIPEAMVEKTQNEIARLRMLSIIRGGELPEINAVGLVKKRGEIVHWAQPAGLIENKVTRKKWEGGSSGVSIRLMRGVTWRVGATRGHFVPVEETLMTSVGWLLISNQRTIFRGDRKSFQFDLDQLLEYGFYQDGMRITPERGATQTLRFTDGNADVDAIGMVLSTVIESYAPRIFGR